MIKKTFIVTAGAVLLLALMFGTKAVPYVQTAFEKTRDRVNQAVPVEFQLDAARKQLNQVDKDFRDMLMQVAKEQVAIDRLEKQLADQQAQLDRQHAHIMTLRDHLDSGDSHFFVSNRSYNRDYVTEDLANRFQNFKTAQATVNKTEEILNVRRQSLEAAKHRLETLQADRQSFELEIENLAARHQMLDVAKSANNIHLDDSRLSRTRAMLDEIKARLDVEEQVLALTPQYFGSIPLEGDRLDGDSDILHEIDAYFSRGDQEMVGK